MMIMIVPLRTKPSGLYRHRRGLGLHKVGYREGNLYIRIAKLAFHAKESPIRTRDEVLSLVSSRSNSLAKVYSPVVRIPPNPGLPHPITQFIPIKGYMATTLACASLHPSMHTTTLFKEGIEEIDGDHTALENAGPFGSRMM